MGLLDGKKALVFGVANQNSIAWGIAQAFVREGAQIGLSYAGEVFEKRVRPLAESVGCTFVEPCDVSDDAAIDTVMAKAGESLGGIDILVHSIAYAGRDDLSGPFYDTTRAGFHMALDVSAYSFVALARAALPVLRPNGALLTVSYLGAVRAVTHYNVMGVAKAALEACVRYLAADLGPHEKHIRVNAVSAGPIRTLAAAGVAGFRTMYNEFPAIAPLRRNVSADDVGNAAAYLCSDHAAGVTGEIHYVDAGYNILGTPHTAKGGEA
jgi:enoyl-[acyl-carrier protein] reductase I